MIERRRNWDHRTNLETCRWTWNFNLKERNSIGKIWRREELAWFLTFRNDFDMLKFIIDVWIVRDKASNARRLVQRQIKWDRKGHSITSLAIKSYILKPGWWFNQKTRV